MQYGNSVSRGFRWDHSTCDAGSKSLVATRIIALAVIGFTIAGCGGDRRSRTMAAPEAPPSSHLNPSVIEQLKTLGYLDYGDRRADSLGQTGVLPLVPGKAYDGLIFYVSADGPFARLLDSTGELIHEWQIEFNQVWPEGVSWRSDAMKMLMKHSSHRKYWRRAFICPNGDVYAIFEGLGMVKLDRESRLLWKSDLYVHHDVDFASNGDILTLTRRAVSLACCQGGETPVLDNYLVVFSAVGKMIKRISIAEALNRSAFGSTWQDWIDPEEHSPQDILHVNSVQLLDSEVFGSDPLWGSDNVLLSIRDLNAIALLDLRREVVVHLIRSSFRKQHHAKLIAQNRLLFFDNRGLGGASTVREVDPFSWEQTWAFGEQEGNRFYSHYQGTCYRLPNGNTLITNSQGGNAFEVTPAAEVVWRFESPHRSTSRPSHVATLFDLQKIPISYFSPDFQKALLVR